MRLPRSPGHRARNPEEESRHSPPLATSGREPQVGGEGGGAGAAEGRFRGADSGRDRGGGRGLRTAVSSGSLGAVGRGVQSVGGRGRSECSEGGVCVSVSPGSRGDALKPSYRGDFCFGFPQKEKNKIMMGSAL